MPGEVVLVFATARNVRLGLEQVEAARAAGRKAALRNASYWNEREFEPADRVILVDGLGHIEAAYAARGIPVEVVTPAPLADAPPDIPAPVEKEPETPAPARRRTRRKKADGGDD